MRAFIRACVALVSVLFWSQAGAVIPAVTGYYTWIGSVTQAQAAMEPQASPLAACTYGATKASAANASFNYIYVSNTQTNCIVKIARKSDGGTVTGQSGSGIQTVAAMCPVNSALSSGTCVCSAGFMEEAGACVPVRSELEDFCHQGALGKFTWPQAGTIGINSSMPGASCYMPQPPFEGADATRGCVTTLGTVVAVPRDGDPLLKDWSGTGVMTGGTCEDATATDAAPKASDDPCPGGFQGTVNGASRCVAAEPDKGIEGVKGTSQTNADGTKVDTKETTKCQGSNCTTTTTTTSTSSSGAVTNSTSSRTESLSDKCASDPSNAVCQKTQGGKGAGVSQGTCQENSSAEGCGGEGAGIGDLYAKKDKTVAQALKKATDALQASPIGSAVGGFFTVGGGGSCPAISGTILFLNAAVVFDQYCSPMAANLFFILRTVLLMVATWAAFRIAIDH